MPPHLAIFLSSIAVCTSSAHSRAEALLGFLGFNFFGFLKNISTMRNVYLLSYT